MRATSILARPGTRNIGTTSGCYEYTTTNCLFCRSSTSLIRRYGGTSTLAAETFASKAINAINHKLDHPNLADIQALCLVIIHEWGSGNAVSAYIYLGQAARMLQMYKIVTIHSHSEYADQFLRDESFRRTLWLIYMLDCLLTSMPGRYPALNVRDTTDVALPCMEMNFAFGNGVYVKTLLQELNHASVSPTHPPSGEVGEYGYIVVAATLWRDVVGMLTTSTLHNYRDDDCAELIAKIDGLRASLPMQLADKPGQINLHMTMGSGYTYAMLHCFLHCATIFVYRRRLLQDVTARNFDLETFRASSACHDIVDRLFVSSHATMALVTAIQSGSDKENLPSFPIFMLFSAFTASATIAYLSLKQLTPSNAVETANHIVTDGIRFMQEGADTWPLMVGWLRHLSIMQRVLSQDASSADRGHQNLGHRDQQSNAKDEINSNADTNPDTTMDYDQQSSNSVAASQPPPPAGEDASGPTSAPRSSVGTANGSGSVGIASPEIKSPQSANTHIVPQIKHEGHAAVFNGHAVRVDGYTTSPEMTPAQLSHVFERQLLELDDLAAFMGGGV